MNYDIRIEDDAGNAYYPHGHAKTNFMSDGKDVETAIGEIANDRGYVVTNRLLDNTSFDDIPKGNGKYELYSNVKAPITSETYWWYVDVTVHDAIYIEQIARPVYIKNSIYRRTLENGIWSEWKEIATSEGYVLQSSDMRNGWVFWAGVYNPIIIKSGKLINITGGAIVNPSAGTSDQIIFNIPAKYRSTISTVSICSAHCGQNKNIVLAVNHTNGNVTLDISGSGSLPSSNEVVIIDISYPLSL